MKADYALILAAGFGTRMGKIGKILPKVVWPVFEKSILEIQVRYAKKIGCRKIFINLHHQAESILNLYKNHPVFRDVHWLLEDPILDIGGAIHNLASQSSVNYDGKLLVLNSDLLFWIPPDSLDDALLLSSDAAAVLFLQKVSGANKYNKVLFDQSNIFIGVEKFNEQLLNENYYTYSGVSLINLAHLERKSGASAFFETVCRKEDMSSKVINLENISYLDFGTLSRYWDSMFHLLDNSSDLKNPMISDLMTWNVLDTKKINLNNCSYHSHSENVINLSPFVRAQYQSPRIILAANSSYQHENSEAKSRFFYYDLSDF